VTSFLKDHREYDAATRLYDFALTIDPLVERYYQGAIETSILQSRYSDAIKRYYQCVAELKEGLGISPSPTTSQLFAKARAMSDAHPGSPMIGTASHPS
jgi:DNA-binding SARP family transcriptional activator